jgi:hypothetical protein
MDAARDAGQSDVVMQVRGRCNCDGIHFKIEQFVDVSNRGAAERARNEFSLLEIWVGDADKFGARQAGKHPGMIATHDADADHADTQRRLRC